MRYKIYDKYKETGVEWLPQIPEGWDLKGLRYCCKFTVGWTPSTKNPAYFDGKNIWVTIADMKSKYIDDSANYVSDLAIKESNVSIIPKGSLLYSFKLSVGKVAFAGKDIYTNEAIFAVLPAKEYSLTYLYYSFPIEVIYNASENIYGAKILNQELIKSANIVFPPLNEQKQIADYLDKKTSKIDLLLQKLERQKELLVEKRSALINKAVTRGLNTDVKMKKTGIEWSPEAPDGWKITRIKRVGSIFGRIGFRGYTVQDIVMEGEGALTLSPSNIQNHIFDVSKCVYLSWNKYHESPEIQIFINDIIIVKTGSTIGKIALVTECSEKMTINPQLVVLKKVKEDAKYLYYTLISSSS
jgi:type I restriction enzyme S subunit